MMKQAVVAIYRDPEPTKHKRGENTYNYYAYAYYNNWNLKREIEIQEWI